METKYIVSASIEELKSIGIPYNIINHEAEFIEEYSSGWICVKVRYFHPRLKIFFNLLFDLPPHYIKKI